MPRDTEHDFIKRCRPALGCYSRYMVILEDHFYSHPDIVPEMSVIIELEQSKIRIGRHFGRHYLHVSGGNPTFEGFILTDGD
jgi:hypothetical protein